MWLVDSINGYFTEGKARDRSQVTEDAGGQRGGRPCLLVASTLWKCPSEPVKRGLKGNPGYLRAVAR